MPNKIAYTCEFCGNTFYKRSSDRQGTHHFCNSRCYGDWIARDKPKVQPYSPEWCEGRVPTQCEACGATRWKKPSHAKKCKRHFCNSKCHGIWMSQNHRGKNSPIYRRVSVPCLVCGKEIERKRDKIKRNDKNFCDLNCYGVWKSENMQGENNVNYNRVVQSCNECGAEITVTPFRLNHSEQHFCNGKCHAAWRAKHITGENHPNWKGGEIDYYGPNWRAQRRLARERDNHRCCLCGISKKKLRRNLDVHHIIPFKEFGYIIGENENYREANDLSNLISLCPSCHKYAEHGHLPVQMRLF